MKTICLYFEIHNIINLKRYRCFDIGRDHYYYDDYENERTINDVAERSYIPALGALIDMAKANNGAFKVALSVSGVALEQLETYAPRVIVIIVITTDIEATIALQIDNIVNLKIKTDCFHIYIIFIGCF